MSAGAVLLERRLEAVYVSFARFNKWEGEKMVVTQKCEGLACNRFVQLCQSAGLVNDTMTVRAVTTIFNTNTDSKVRTDERTISPLHDAKTTSFYRFTLYSNLA
jgi:hypothetical protein